MITLPSIIKEDSLLTYVRKYLLALQTYGGAISVKEWALKVGVSSRVTFRQILKGKRKITGLQLQAIQNQLDLGHIERLAIDHLPLGNTIPTKKEQFFASSDFFATPLNTIVLNLCALNKPMQYQGIRVTLKDLFREEEIQKSISLLLQNNLIAKDEAGNLKRIFNGDITSLPGAKSTFHREYYKSSYAIADKAWDLDLHLREISAFTFRISLNDVPKLKDLIRKFREDITIFSQSEKTDSVYQCSIAAVPIYLASKTDESYKA